MDGYVKFERFIKTRLRFILNKVHQQHPNFIPQSKRAL